MIGGWCCPRRPPRVPWGEAMSQAIADFAAKLMQDDPTMNPLIAVITAMQALDPKPGVPIVMDCVSHERLSDDN